MNTAAPLHGDQPTQDLNTALRACFAHAQHPPFANRLVGFAAALTNASSVSLWSRGDDAICLARSGEAAIDHPIAADAELEDGTPAVAFVEGRLLAHIAMPDGTEAILSLLPPPGVAAQGLAYERTALLANLSFATHRNEDIRAHQTLAEHMSAVAAGDHAHLQPLVDALGFLTGAEYAAVGVVDGSSATDIVVSGQTGFAKRAALVKRVRDRLNTIAETGLVRSDSALARRPGQTGGLVMLTEASTRNPGTLPLAAALFQQAGHHSRETTRLRRRLRNLAAIVLAATVVGFVPLPDGAEVPAIVQAVNARVITAPLSTQLTGVVVTDGTFVTAGDPIAKLDDEDIALELVGLQAERATAVLEQESARASRNPSLLRNAELNVARLDSRIALLTHQRETSVLTAPITGIVVLNDLEQRVGTTVRQGDPLFEVADPGKLRLDLTVLGTRISDVSDETPGTFRPDFDPTLTSPAKVSVIYPAIDMTANPPTLSARAEFLDAPIGLRPGVSGVFSVGGETEPIWRIVSRNLHHWFLLNVWP